MPLLRMTMYAKGIQLYCAPTADGRDSWLATMQHIALEGRCFVLSCNQFAQRRDYPPDYQTPFGDDPETVLSRGGSCIVNPLGQILVGPNYNEECILTAELDLADIARGKFDFDVAATMLAPISSRCRSTNTHSLLSSATRAEMRAATWSRQSVRLVAIFGAAWFLRWLWVRYGQYSRAIRLFNRSVLNPLTLTFAGRAGMPYATLSHIGRRSGKSYATPLLVQPVAHGWIIPLTYGKVTDWYRNIEQAGGCRIRWQGKSYQASRPERLDTAHALPLFPPALRLALRIAGIRQFICLTRA